MAVTKIRGNVQIQDGTVDNAQIGASAAIATSKLADAAEFLQRDGSIALTGDLSAGSNKITNLAAPTSDNDAARKVDVDLATAGLDVKDSVRLASTANVVIASALESGDTIDGVVLAEGDRVLLKDQSSGDENGIYVAVAAAAGAASRSTDADTDAKVNANMFMFVEEGSANADTAWVLTTNEPIVLDTTVLVFTQFAGNGAGAVNSASNVNVGGVGVFKQLNASDLEFRGINTSDSIITVTLDAANNEIDLAIASDSITNTEINSSAAIARSKLASGTLNHVLINDGSGVMSSEATLAVSRGGTNAGTALNNNRVLQSSGDAIVEAAAITGSRALESDSNGIPVASAVTATELGHLDGVTSALQTQLDAKMAEADFVDKEVPSGLINGANTTYTLANTPIAGSDHVYLNGILQQEGAGNDYTISGLTITYLAAPQTNDKLIVTYRK